MYYKFFSVYAYCISHYSCSLRLLYSPLQRLITLIVFPITAAHYAYCIPHYSGSLRLLYFPLQRFITLIVFPITAAHYTYCISHYSGLLHLLNFQLQRHFQFPIIAYHYTRTHDRVRNIFSLITKKFVISKVFN